MTVADASVLEGLDQYTSTADVEQNSIRPEPTLARNLWALPKRGGPRLFATITFRTVSTISSLLSDVTVFAVQAARATCLPNVFNDHEILGMCHQPASFLGDVSGVNACLRRAIGTHTSTRQQTACTNFLPVMFKGYEMVPHIHLAADCVHVLLDRKVQMLWNRGGFAPKACLRRLCSALPATTRFRFVRILGTGLVAVVMCSVPA